MANVKKQQSIITLDSGVQAPCQEPIVVSASRSTDIPAFYADWFFHRLSVGYSAWTNPFNGAKSYVSYHKTRFIVFWSKNPRPLLPYLDVLKQRGIGCYVQYTLNDYEAEGLERGVPPLAVRIETFRLLVEKLGKGAVVWRFDPLVLTEQMDVQALLQKIARIGDELRGYTEKLVFSFADITSYRKVKANLERNHVHYIDWTDSMMIEFAKRLVQMNREKGWNYVLATCGERINLDGIAHNHCVDDSLMIRLSHHDKELMKFLHAQIYPMPTQDLFGEATPLPPDAIVLDDGTYAMRGDNQDRGQRIYCGCMKSKDVGEYDTCPHQCEYCYANTSKEAALYNYRQHMANPYMDTITGK